MTKRKARTFDDSSFYQRFPIMKKNYENSRARVTEFIQQNSYQWFFRIWLHFINVTFIQNTQKQQSSH
ncbi:hypothetical protein VIAG107301_00910 [Vibrio agarivorans]